MKSKPTICLLLCAIIFISFTIRVNGQDKNTVLVKGLPVSEVLTAGEKHRYTINLEAGMFAGFVLEQNGIDIMITSYSPDGQRLKTFDSPNGRKGPERASITSDKKGSYVLEITALEEKGRKGNYSLTWMILEPKGATPQKQIDQLFYQWNIPNYPGAAVAVEKDGQIIFEKGYGSAEPEYNIPITPTTVFHIASVSKQFTCFSILLLEKEGKLSINDDIRKYIPEVPDFGKVITLNNLMHHTSGLRDQWELLGMAGWRIDDNITKDHILRLISRQKELNFNPGDEYLYCNTGFTLLAEVVARVSGQSFADFTRTHIFEPLRMKNTQFYDNCEKVVKNRAYSFYIDSTGIKKSNLSYSTVGATSLFTTAEDLCLWARNFETPVVGDRDLINRMNLRGRLNKGDTLTYAMGQDIVPYKGLTMYVHGGADAGYRSFLVRFPDQKFSVNVLSNLASFDPGSVGLAIADIYLKDKEKVNPPMKPEPVKPAAEEKKGMNVDHGLLVSYCGQYELQPGNIATISLDNETLYATAPGLPKTGMAVLSENEFEVKEVAAKVAFLKGESGKIDRMKVQMNGGEAIAMRIPDFDPAKVDLAEYTGEYYSPELNTSYTFVVESGALVARHFRTGDIILTPTSPDHFSGNQWYFSLVEATREQGGKINGLKVTTGRVRSLKFEKLR